MYKYIKTNDIKIEIYCGNGEEPINLGHGNIKLVELEKQNTYPDKSAVIRGNIMLVSYLEDSRKQLDIGFIEYSVRFRYPIYNRIQKLKDIEKLGATELNYEL